MAGHMTLHRSQSTPPGALDVWQQNPQQGTGLGFPAAPPPQPPVSPLAKIQRLLRGRVLLAIVCAIIGAVAGGIAGFVSAAPTYHAEGLLQIDPVVPMVDGDKPIAFFQQFLQTQAGIIASPMVLNEMQNNDPWKSAYGDDKDALPVFASNLKSDTVKGTFQIRITSDSRDPEMPHKGIQTIIKIYKAQYAQSGSADLNKKEQKYQQDRRDLEDALKVEETRKTDVTKKYGSENLQPLVDSINAEWSERTKELRRVKGNIESARKAIEAMKLHNAEIPLEELIEADDTMTLKNMVAARNAAENTVRLDMIRKGAKHPDVVAKQQELGAYETMIEDYVIKLRNRILAVITDPDRGTRLVITPGILAGMEARVTQLETEVREIDTQRSDISSANAVIATSNSKIRDVSKKLEDNNKYLDSLQYALANGGTLREMASPMRSSKTSDKKIMMAGAGMVGGALIPVGLLLLIGLADSRFRYSDDAAGGNALSGIPLLGILPNLPDRLADPAQASIAAHCVHQIRTMLQLNAMREGSTVFSITSASSGDGKTSLSLALGLSFAASGSRTLLIDSDIIGGGLSSRLGVDSSVGIVEALAGTRLEDIVQHTDVTDLSILPIGKAQAHHAGGFSPAAVRRLIAECRKHFEVIVIDTGPVMGSIEATPICASVDGVVLTVARGQSRPLVERAITHLQSVGAQLAGLVFNRAQHRDFEQSIGAISLRSAARSAANGTTHNASRPSNIGAVAAAVASSVRSEEN